jgi:glutamate synthase domain-containing protein 1
MPPPKASSEGPRDRQVTHEIIQILRALRDRGAQDPAALRGLVGADYWDSDRFDRALALSVADGLVVPDAEGRLQVV